MIGGERGIEENWYCKCPWNGEECGINIWKNTFSRNYCHGKYGEKLGIMLKTAFKIGGFRRAKNFLKIFLMTSGDYDGIKNQ